MVKDAKRFTKIFHHHNQTRPTFAWLLPRVGRVHRHSATSTKHRAMSGSSLSLSYLATFVCQRPLAELVRGTQRHSSGSGFDSSWLKKPPRLPHVQNTVEPPCTGGAEVRGFSWTAVRRSFYLLNNVVGAVLPPQVKFFLATFVSHATVTSPAGQVTFGLLDVAFFGEPRENCCKTHDHGDRKKRYTQHSLAILYSGSICFSIWQEYKKRFLLQSSYI